MSRAARPRQPRPVSFANLPRNGPSQMRANLESSHRFRFVSSNGAATTVSTRDLLQACGCVATTATSASGIFGSVRLKQIELWTPAPSQGASATCSVRWYASNAGIAPNREVSDTSVSTATPAHLRTSPPRGSLTGFWQVDGLNSQLFDLVAPPGTIIDVWVDLILADGPAEPGAAALTVAGATVGALYYFALDGRASGLYLPVSLTTV